MAERQYLLPRCLFLKFSCLRYVVRRAGRPYFRRLSGNLHPSDVQHHPPRTVHAGRRMRSPQPHRSILPHQPFLRSTTRNPHYRTVPRFLDARHKSHAVIQALNSQAATNSTASLPVPFIADADTSPSAPYQATTFPKMQSTSKSPLTKPSIAGTSFPSVATQPIHPTMYCDARGPALPGSSLDAHTRRFTLH